jgi:chromosome segregation ATPase
MEFEQIIKRLDWLDEEHRKDKAVMDSLSEQLAKTNGDLKIANKKIKELSAQLSPLTSLGARIDQFNAVVAQQRTDILKYVDEMDGKDVDKLPEAEKRIQMQIDNLNRYIAELRKFKDPIAEIKRELKSSAAEEIRHDKQIAEWGARIEAVTQTVDEVKLLQKAAEGPRRQDSKRLADLQGEISAARKRMEEVREKNDLFNDNFRRIETRLNELLTSEAERRQAQTNFIESQSLLHVERERAWKEWETGLESIRRETGMMDQHLQEWDVAQRAVKRAQETYEEIVQKFERRINEISEMQRLAEDRFRQELVAFKADDQKRWTSYTLSQDENLKDARAGFGKLEERLTVLEDSIQTQQDIIQQTRDANEQLFQGLLAQIHEFLSMNERIISPK